MSDPIGTRDIRIITIGASAGGVEAVLQIARELPPDIPAALFVSLHFPPDAPSVLPRILDRAGPLRAVHPRDGERIEPGVIYVSVPDYHLIVKSGFVRLTRGPKENGHRPAIDPMFRSAAVAYGTRVIGVVLSGNLADGTAGLHAVKRRGGIAIAQDPEDALFPGMPRSAIEHVAVDHIVPLSAVAQTIDRLAREPAPTQGVSLVPDDMEYEEEVAEDGADASKAERKPGKESGFGCPDCGGALWEITDGEFFRFRCRVGHAWTPENLLAEQSNTLEEAMWTALRALEESAALSRQLAARSETRGQPRSAKLFEERARRTEQQAQSLRVVLLEEPQVGVAAPVPPSSDLAIDESERSA